MLLNCGVGEDSCESLWQQGDPEGNQPWIFIGNTDAETEAPILWPHDTKSQLIEKDLNLGKTEGRRRRGQRQRMRWLDGIIASMDMKWSESHSVASNTLQPHGLYSPWNSPGHNTGVGRLFLLQGIFPNQGLDPGLLHCRWILYQLSHKGSLFNGHEFEQILGDSEGQGSLMCCHP